MKTRSGYVCTMKVYFDHDEESVATVIDSVTKEHVNVVVAEEAELHDDDHSDIGVKPEFVAPALTSGTTCDVNLFHELLGHPSEEKTRLIAKYYGVELSGRFKTCGACAKAKANRLIFQRH